MSNPNLGQLRRLDPRTVWQHEAQDFTPWLAENVDLLSEAVGLDIELVQREVPVGTFSLDLFGKEVSSGREVIVENQLEATDHIHLGQLLTYAAGLDAKVVVWISPQFRDEHRQAVEWLNLQTNEHVAFFAVELELLQIDNSSPAPHFKVVAQPSEWQKEASASGRQPRSERQLAYHDFFSDFLDQLKATSLGFTNVRRVGYDNWMAFGSGTGGFGIVAEFMRPHWFRVQVYIDTGDKARNKSAFDQLLEQRDALESQIGESLEWLRLDDKRACRIFVQREGSIDSPPEVLETLKNWAVSQVPAFKEVFGSRLKALDLEMRSEDEGVP